MPGGAGGVLGGPAGRHDTACLMAGQLPVLVCLDAQFSWPWQTAASLWFPCLSWNQGKDRTGGPPSPQLVLQEIRGLSVLLTWSGTAQRASVKAGTHAANQTMAQMCVQERGARAEASISCAR